MIQDQLKSSTKTSELFINYGRISNKTNNDQISETVKRDIFESNLVPFARISSNCAFLAKNIQGVWTFMASYLQIKRLRNLTNIFSEKNVKETFLTHLGPFFSKSRRMRLFLKDLAQDFFPWLFFKFYAKFSEKPLKTFYEKVTTDIRTKGRTGRRTGTIS